MQTFTACTLGDVGLHHAALEDGIKTGKSNYISARLPTKRPNTILPVNTRASREQDELIYLMEKRCCHRCGSILEKLKLLTSAQLTGREDVQPHEGSGSDRMQRHQMEREIIDCNMITGIMVMAEMEGLRGGSCGG